MYSTKFLKGEMKELVEYELDNSYSIRGHLTKEEVTKAVLSSISAKYDWVGAYIQIRGVGVPTSGNHFQLIDVIEEDGLVEDDFYNRIVNEYKLIIKRFRFENDLKLYKLEKTEYLKYGNGYDIAKANFIFQQVNSNYDSSSLYDSEEYYGISHHMIKAAWFAAGARDNLKFRAWAKLVGKIIDKYGKIELTAPLPLPKATESVEAYKRRCQLYLRFSDSFKFSNIRLIDKTRLSKMSYEAQYVAINYCLQKKIVKKYTLRRNLEGLKIDERTKKLLDIDKRKRGFSETRLINLIGEDKFIEYKDLFFECNREITTVNFQKLSKFLKDDITRLLYFKAQWGKSIGRVPKGATEIKGFSPIDLIKEKSMFKTFRYLMSTYSNKINMDNKSDLENLYVVSCTLSAMFRTKENVIRWIKVNSQDSQDSTFLAAHDAAQFNFYLNTSKIDWGNLLIKFPELQWETDYFKLYEDEFGYFTTISHFREWRTIQKYNFKIDKDLSLLGSKYNISRSKIKNYIKFFDKNSPKSSEMIPHVHLESSNYTMETLEFNDKEGVMLGLATGCCQHLHNAGKPCAIAGYVNSDSCFWVIRDKKGDIKVQSWVWLSKKGEVVIDSIEGFVKDRYLEEIASLYKQAAEKLINHYLINSVVVSTTSYGLTDKVADLISQGNKFKPGKMINEVSYTDAEKVKYIAQQ